MNWNAEEMPEVTALYTATGLELQPIEFPYREIMRKSLETAEVLDKLETSLFLLCALTNDPRLRGEIPEDLLDIVRETYQVLGDARSQLGTLHAKTASWRYEMGED